MKAAWFPDKGGPPGSSTEALVWSDRKNLEFIQNLDEHQKYLPSSEVEWLQSLASTDHHLSAPTDLVIKVSERVKHLDRPDLWLGENDTDWHIPILLTLREYAFRNWRKRSAPKCREGSQKGQVDSKQLDFQTQLGT